MIADDIVKQISRAHAKAMDDAAARLLLEGVPFIALAIEVHWNGVHALTISGKPALAVETDWSAFPIVTIRTVDLRKGGN